MYCSSATTKSSTTASQQDSSDVADIERLLQDVETSFLTNLKPYNPNKIVVSLEEARKCPCSKKTETDWEEVERVIREFKFQDTNPFCRSNNKSWVRPQQISGPVDEQKPKEESCYRVYLSGSYEVTGHSLPGYEKPCSNLKCSACNTPVEYFDNYAWDPTTDRAFLRNNIPAHFEKIVKQLILRRGTRAYACKCQHVSISKLTNVGAHYQLRWVCGKHTVSERNTKK